MSLISIDDIGKICYEVFMNPERYNGRSIDLVGDAVEVSEIARALGVKMGNYPLEKLHYYYQQYYTFLNKISPTQTRDLLKRCEDVLPEPIDLNKWLSLHRSELALPGRAKDSFG